MDLAKTNAQWDRWLGREFGMRLGLIRVLRELLDSLHREREQIRIVRDATAYLGTSGATSDGADLGVNTTEDGIVYIRLTGGGDPRTASAYKATGGGGGDLVAQGTANAGNVATMTPQNSSGLSMTWHIPTPFVATSGDEIAAHIFTDWRLRALRVHDGDEPRDTEAREGFQDLLNGLRSAIASLKGSAVAELGQWAAAQFNRGAEFTGRTFSSLISDVAREDESGNVSRQRTGFLPFIKQAMADNTPTVQTVVRIVPSAAAGVFASGNAGAGAVDAHTPQEHCPELIIELSCVRGYDTEDIGDEEFSGFARVTETGETIPVNGVRVGRSFSGPRGIGPFTLERVLAKTDAGSRFTAASTAVVSGESNRNTDAGVLYISIAANGPNWDISFFRAATRLATDLVAKAENIATSATFTATERRGSGLQVAWQLSGTVAADVTPSLDLQPFAIENDDGVPDSFSIDVTHAASPGLIQQITAEELGTGAESRYHLNSAAAGAETIGDGFASAGTFTPFAVRDN